ncbi:MAG: DEAD/DEAH box helicase [Euryarchaeota archaeon]|nr:DEAD/DEAH box helicase [Euryarchaeota archaeon]
MIVLHAIGVLAKENASGSFCFWGESQKLFEAIKSSKGESKLESAELIHPFQAPEQEILAALSTFDGIKNRKHQNRWQTILLPTIGDYPEHSHKHFDELSRKLESGAKLKLAPWKIRCIELPMYETLQLLVRVPEKSTELPAEVSLGADLKFWSATAKFALELLARQRFLPSVIDRKVGVCAAWRAVINTPNDLQRLKLLAESMPPVCRALLEKSRSPSTEISLSPRELIIDFLNSIVDATIRKWFADELNRSRTRMEQLLGRENLMSTWFRGLSFSNPSLKGTTHELKILRESAGLWTASIDMGGQELPWRTCFRLEEPEYDSNQNEWYLSFHLQATDDRSLLIPAKTLWKNDSTLKFLNRKFNHPQEIFLEDLAKASRLFTPIEQSLKAPLPVGCTLKAEQAWWFLKEGSWLLEESGYGIFVPSWWTEKGKLASVGIRIKVEPKASSPSASFFTLANLVDFSWQLAVGDETLTYEEFKKLAQLKIPLVRVRGKWVELNKEQVESAIKYFQKLEEGGLTLANALRIGLGQEKIGLPIVRFDAGGWLKDLVADGDNAHFNELATPTGFKGTLRPYQVRGFSWLVFLSGAGLGACLADDMGLGKTIELIAALLHDKHKKKTQPTKPVLLICSTSIVGNWKRELERFAPLLKVMIHHGSERYSGKSFMEQAKQHELVISTYSLAHRDKKDLQKVNWAGIVLDEAQNIKNPYTKQAQAVRCLSVGYRIALTGTPIENRLNELWSIMEFLNPGYLGSLNDFRQQFAIPIERYQDQEVSKKLRRLVQPFILRRLKTDKRIIQDLPEKLEMKVCCTLTREQATLYKATVDDMMSQIERSKGIQRKGLVFSTLMKLKQICNHPVLFLKDRSIVDKRSGKLMRLVEMLEEVLAEGDRALIFTQFVTMGEILQKHIHSLFGQEVLFLHGGVSRNLRDKMIARFQEDEHAPPIFILSIKAGGFGLNLTKANHVFHFDRWWNPAVENQATDRAFRIGQTRNVQVHKFVCIGTLEERIDQMLEMKKGLAENILGTDESWLTELSNEQLRDIFALRADAIQDE